MRNSFVSWLTAAVIAFGFCVSGVNAANAESVMRTCATEWKQAQAAWNDRRSELASVLGAVPYAPGFARRAVLADGSSRAGPSVRLPIPMVAAVGADFHRGLKCRRSRGRPKRHEAMRKPMERRQGRGNDRRPDAGRSFCRNAARAKAPPLRPRAVSLPRRPLPQRPLLPPSQALCSRGGNSRRPRPRPHRTSARPRPCRRANTQRSSAARARCPSDTVVWVNTPTRIYHYSGTRYYGHTLKGAYMCEADARAAGYRAARNRQREAEAH